MLVALLLWLLNYLIYPLWLKILKGGRGCTVANEHVNEQSKKRRRTSFIDSDPIE